MMIIAIDPGPVQSAYVIINEDCKIYEFDKVENEKMLEIIADFKFSYPDGHLIIEMVASYGMKVGATVFETCVWIGKYLQKAHSMINQGRMFRREVKLNICQDSRAKDGNIITALIDRFAKHDFERGKGTKDKKDWFYGFKSDVWQAYALAVTYVDKYINEVAK